MITNHDTHGKIVSWQVCITFSFKDYCTFVAIPDKVRSYLGSKVTGLHANQAI